MQVNQNLVALQAACVALNQAIQAQRDGNKAARVIGSSVWAESVKVLSNVPADKAEATCSEMRAIAETTALCYKTLTSAVSTAFRAIKLAVPLYDKKGELIGRTTIEKHCQQSEASAMQKNDPAGYAEGQAKAQALQADTVVITHAVISKVLTALLDQAVNVQHADAIYAVAFSAGITAKIIASMQAKYSAMLKAEKALADEKAAQAAQEKAVNNPGNALHAMRQAQIIAAEREEKAAAEKAASDLAETAMLLAAQGERIAA
jgi:hypothetical protein